MKFAVSNIGWAPSDRDIAYALLRAHGIQGLEIAPGLFFDGASDPFDPAEAEAERAVSATREAGLELISMQSLLFGQNSGALFEGESEREKFARCMLRAITLAGRLSIRNMVFGSPRQRNIPEGMSPEMVDSIAIPLFRVLGDAAARVDTKLAIEFNPIAYGTNFLTNVSEATAFVERVNHPAVSLTLDLGAMHMNQEFYKLDQLAPHLARRISHVHISEPHLLPAPASADQTAYALSALEKEGYDGWYSVEMKPQPEPGLTALANGLNRLLQAAALAGQRPRS